MLKKANEKKCSKIRVNLMFLPVKNYAHDNFFCKITTKKLRKFMIFLVFCKTLRKIADKNHIFTVYLRRVWDSLSCCLHFVLYFQWINTFAAIVHTFSKAYKISFLMVRSKNFQKMFASQNKGKYKHYFSNRHFPKKNEKTAIFFFADKISNITCSESY